MEHLIRQLIESKNYDAIDQQLSNTPGLANEGIPLDEKNTAKAHPLHRICDAIIAGKITDEEGIKIAKIFLHHGAKINGDEVSEKDTPLITAASLQAEQTGIFYIEKGADVRWIGTNGATALHWAAYCGRDELVKRLIHENAEIDLRDSVHNATPLVWAIHPLITNNKFNKHHQVECIKLLLRAGSDKRAMGEEMFEYLLQLGNTDSELQELLN